MRYNVIITDKQGDTATCSVNAVSMKQALRKGKDIGEIKDIWYKRIQVFDPQYMDVVYNKYAFPLFVIK